MCTYAHDTLIEENCLSQVQLNAIARCNCKVSAIYENSYNGQDGGCSAFIP